MPANAHNKENVAPDHQTASAAGIPVAETTGTVEIEDPYSFVEIYLGPVNDQIEESTDSNSGSSNYTPQIDKKGKGAETTVDEDEEDTDEDGMDELGSMESSPDLGDVGLEELLEIEKEIPDDLDLSEPPPKPYTSFENQPRSQGSLLSQIYPLVLDPRDLPAPLQVRKSSYFSKDSPMETESEFEEDDEEGDNWFEEGEIVEDGIRRNEVEMSIAEWRLNRHPRFGRYRVKEISCLRICETIEEETPNQNT
ncbi:hypothetical protein BKA65DRAFT_545391 [Rhexocercosporidium sp. MPI-PUGE-AT-0058]|nr:hypothetical protein BKA65DRAFT_545391 [Rhexocercosporidium sp. MPI-PUGE-AT-0058]